MKSVPPRPERAKCAMESRVFRIGRSHYAPRIEDEEALALAQDNGGQSALVVRFHSDLPLKGAEPEWRHFEGRGYMTNNYGWVTGQTYVIPVKHALGTLPLKDGNRACFRLPNGKVIGINIQPGCPECPARARVVEVPNV